MVFEALTRVAMNAPQRGHRDFPPPPRGAECVFSRLLAFVFFKGRGTFKISYIVGSVGQVTEN